jgi:hypothetical protein
MSRLRGKFYNPTLKSKMAAKQDLAASLENVSVGHYRSLDLPKNLAFR